MGLINFTPITDGTTADAADVNSPLTTIYNEFNGNISNANIASNAAIAGSKLADDSVTAAKLDSDAIGHGYLEIARTTLGSNGDTITVSSIPARKYIKVVAFFTATGGNVTANLTFNGDTGNTYARRQSVNGGTDATVTSQSSIGLSSAATDPNYYYMDFANLATQEKVVDIERISRGTAGAGNAPDRIKIIGKWANTSNQVTSMTLTNAGTGDFASGSEIVVFGTD